MSAVLTSSRDALYPEGLDTLYPEGHGGHGEAGGEAGSHEDLDKHYSGGQGGHGEAGGHKGRDMLHPEGSVEAMGKTPFEM